MSPLAEPPRPRADAVLLLASAGCALTVLDTNVVGVVLPTIARDLSASFADIEWVVSAYVLCFAALLLPAGTLADRIGRRRLYRIGLLLFAVTSVACGLAATASVLYLARAAQGAAAAFMLAPALSLIGHAHQDAASRARAWAIWGAIMGLTMVLAPLIGGAIATWLGWRWAFHINLPLCLLLAASSGRRIAESRDPVRRRIDVAGVLLFAGSMLAWTWALIRGPLEGWASAAVLPWLLAGALLGSAFIVVERRCAQPMLDLALFRIPALGGAVVAMFAYAAAVQVMASLLPCCCRTPWETACCGPACTCCRSRWQCCCCRSWAGGWGGTGIRDESWRWGWAWRCWATWVSRCRFGSTARLGCCWR